MYIVEHFKRMMHSERGSWFYVAALAVSAIAGGVSAYGSYQQGQAQKKMNQYSADVAAQQQQLNTRITEQNVTLTQDQAKMEAKQQAVKVAGLEGAQKATLAAQGVGGGSVTAADIATSTFDTAKLDEMAIRYNADVRSWGIRNNLMYQNWDLENQRKQYLMAGKNAATAGNIKAVGTLLSTAGQVLGSATTKTGTGVMG